jgi:hypothetical protein
LDHRDIRDSLVCKVIHLESKETKETIVTSWDFRDPRVHRAHKAVLEILLVSRAWLVCKGTKEVKASKEKMVIRDHKE